MDHNELRSERRSAWQAFLDGRHEEAFAKWASVLAAHNDTRDYMTRGTAYLLVHDFSRAREDFLQVRRLWPAITVVDVGIALWLDGEREAACEDWWQQVEGSRAGKIIFVDPAGGVQVPALLWWASGHPELRKWRKPAVDELRRRARTKWCQRRGWPGPLAYFLLGQKSEETLLEDSSSKVQELQHRQRCQAYFYMAAVCLDRGDEQGYRQHLANCLAEGFNPLEPEYFLAQAEMNRPG